MTNDERDKMLIEIHADMRVTSSTVKELAKDVWGNGQPGVKEDVAIMKQNYRECPAKKAHSLDNRKMKISTIVMIVTIISAIGSILFGILTHI